MGPLGVWDGRITTREGGGSVHPADGQSNNRYQILDNGTGIVGAG